MPNSRFLSNETVKLSHSNNLRRYQSLGRFSQGDRAHKFSLLLFLLFLITSCLWSLGDCVDISRFVFVAIKYCFRTSRRKWNLTVVFTMLHADVALHECFAQGKRRRHFECSCSWIEKYLLLTFNHHKFKDFFLVNHKLVAMYSEGTIHNSAAWSFAQPLLVSRCVIRKFVRVPSPGGPRHIIPSKGSFRLVGKYFLLNSLLLLSTCRFVISCYINKCADVSESAKQSRR